MLLCYTEVYRSSKISGSEEQRMVSSPERTQSLLVVEFRRGIEDRLASFG